MLKLVQELRSTNSSNSKIDFIKQYINDSTVKEVLKYTYDPFFQTNLRKVNVASTGSLSFSDVYSEFKILLFQLNRRDLTGNAARDAVTKLLNKCTSETQELITNIIQKDLKCKLGASLINKAIPGLVPEFDIQLANTYDKSIKKKEVKLVPYYYESPKLDGLRGYHKATMISRSGKPILGFEDTIEPELNDLMDKHKFDFMDGELYSHNVPFQTIQSYVNRKVNIDPLKKKEIYYYIFVAGRDWKDTKEMYDYLQNIPELSSPLPHLNYHYVKLLPVTIVKNDLDEITKVTELHMSQGYEGTMLRHPKNWYAWKRDDNLLKHKLFIESDFTITGYYEGEGEFEGTLGGFKIEGEFEGNKIRSEVGSGFKVLPEFLDNRSELWRIRRDLPGQTVEVKFQGITDKPSNDGYYSLRFPVYLKLKQDR